MKHIVGATFGLIFCVALWSSLKGQPVFPPIVLSPFSIGSVEWKEEHEKENKRKQEEREEDK